MQYTSITLGTFVTVAAGPLFNFYFQAHLFVVYMNQGVTKFPITVEEVFGLPIRQRLKRVIS